VIAELAGAAEATTGEPPALVASTATTDARQWALQAGTPAICFGPHAEHVHSIDERVWLPSVLHTAQALALFIASWCGLSQI
jgi:acetylornithine deacetylase